MGFVISAGVDEAAGHFQNLPASEIYFGGIFAFWELAGDLKEERRKIINPFLEDFSEMSEGRKNDDVAFFHAHDSR